MDASPPHRPIRSFVLRQGRMTEAQQRAFDAHWARYGLDYSGTPRDFDAVFGRRAPRVLEVGFGNGEQLHASARAHPEWDHVGLEVHGPGVGRLLNAVAQDELSNVRVYRHDAVEVLQHEVGPASLALVRVFFPDPWPKKRHHKRRLVQPAFVALVASRLAPGGALHLATDWADYAEQMRATCDACPALRRVDADGRDRRVQTHFERRGLRLGHAVSDFLYERA